MYNKYSIHIAGFYNKPAQFLSASERGQTGRFNVVPPPALAQPRGPAWAPAHVKMEDVDMLDPNTQFKKEIKDGIPDDKEPPRPAWMKSKLSGVKKISNKERRRRQNENLRRLLSPKNALMVLNEMTPKDQLANQFRVETVPSSNLYFKTQSFSADLTLDGCTYKGFGDNKLMARNAAAEQAIRDLVIKKMSKVCAGEASGVDEEEPLPMIQLASFALHKLFCEWEVAGHKVPQLKASAPTSEADASAEPAPAQPVPTQPAPARPAKKQKTLPADAALMHPCMLLTYMRPSLEYRELAAQGDRPQNMLYTVGLEVDGTTYIGKAPNKKEARRAAACAACKELFGVDFQNM